MVLADSKLPFAAAYMIAAPLYTDMTVITIKISNIDCAACVERIDKALLSLPGVTDAAASYTSGRAVIRFDEAKLTLSELVCAIQKAGFVVPEDRVQLTHPVLDEASRDALSAALQQVFGVHSVEAGSSETWVSLWPIGVDSRKLILSAREGGAHRGRG